VRAHALTLACETLVVSLYTVTLGLCGAATGILAALGLCDLAFQLGLVRANANIDDDAMMITVGWAMAGGLLGLGAGGVIGARAIWPDMRQRARVTK